MPINCKKNGCHKEVVDSIITLNERGSRVKLDIENPGSKRYLRTQVDGHYIKNQEAADYMLSCCQSGRSLLVELKGNNTVKGCDQLISTYAFLKNEGVFVDEKVPAVLIGTQVRPKARADIAKRKVQYMRTAKKKIHIHNRQHKAKFDSFF